MSNDPIIRTDNVLVRIMVLGKDSSTDWHYHSRVGDFFVCLSGAIKLETTNPDETMILLPGQRAEVKPQQVHRVSNIHNDQSEYLLVQGVGEYDFVKVEIL
jgi:quercetin dioxygenase-like cupin family protein